MFYNNFVNKNQLLNSLAKYVLKYLDNIQNLNFKWVPIHFVFLY